MSVTPGTMSVVERLAAKGYSASAITSIVGPGAPHEAIRSLVSGARSRAEEERAETRRLRRKAEEALEAMRRVQEWKRAAALSHYRTIPVRSATRSMAEIIRDTAQKHGLSPRDFTCSSRSRPLVEARQEAMFLCACETEWSLPVIGKHFGGRDHTTVIHSIRKHAARHGLPLPRGMRPGGAA